jgi:hypothetical protein
MKKKEKTKGNKTYSFRLILFLNFLSVKIHFPVVDSNAADTHSLIGKGAKLLNSMFIGFPE